MTIPIPRVIVSISGGCVSSVYADHPIELYLFDWDNIQEGYFGDTKDVSLAGFRDHGDLCIMDDECFAKHANDYLGQVAEQKAEAEKIRKEFEE